MTFSTAVVLVKTDHIHDCSGARGGCATCAAVNSAVGVIKSLSMMYAASAATACGLLWGAWNMRLTALRRKHFSPVTLRVRLNN
jgi:hypothetical protein